jgi:hypothetical protein
MPEVVMAITFEAMTCSASLPDSMEPAITAIDEGEISVGHIADNR